MTKMTYFLEHIAKSLYSEFGSQIGDHFFVFPGRRAGLFFRKYLASVLKGPVWLPTIMTINDLFRTCSDLNPAENEILLFELYRVYRSIQKSPESFDEFFFWGDMLLNDFDDVDKYLVDASRLFRNVLDLKKIDQEFGGLTEEQTEIIRRFWINLDPEKTTAEKTKFISIWSLLEGLYPAFRKALSEKAIAYEGMIYRDVAENHLWEADTVARYRIFHFIGFNALNNCEKALMSGLKKMGRARFYWDYDNSYIKAGQSNSAGYFLRKNLEEFGNDMPGNWSFDTLLSDSSGKAVRRVIDTSSDIAQVKLVPRVIGEMNGIGPENEHQTVVVLADENLLLPLLSSLPAELSDVNITMGFPLRQTNVYSLVKNIIDLQHNAFINDSGLFFDHADVLKILKNSLIAGMTDKDIIAGISEKNLTMVPAQTFGPAGILHEIFRKISGPDKFPGYLRGILLQVARNNEKAGDEGKSISMPGKIRNEFIYRVVLSINRLENATGNSEIIFLADTWGRILDRLLRIQSVPFSGEPLSGLQVMGILETRALDFRNLIMVSVNEGTLPSVTASSSFVPFSLREAFGLPSINHQESVYAYHFYRLLHRAENVTFIYNSDPEGLKSGEVSRFIQQMKYEPSLKPGFSNVSYEIRNPSYVSTSIDRTEEIASKLTSRYLAGADNKMLSPSAINTWLNCSMRFYYRYVCELKEPEGISEEIDPAMLGTILHEAMRDLYSEHTGKILSCKAIKAISENQKLIDQFIGNAIKRQFTGVTGSVAAVNGNIARNVLAVFVSRVLEIDMKTAPFTILELEKPLKFRMDIQTPAGKKEIMTGGVADRIDLKDGTTRIVDYKTGKTAESIKSISDLFMDDRSKEADAWLQTLLYCEAYLNDEPEIKIRPSVYKIKNIPHDEPADRLIIKASRDDAMPLENYDSARQAFMEGLSALAFKITASDEPFLMTSDIWNKCSYCPYNVLCMR
ncbi:MAG: PD-(D/E)XK nuclease family protein [Bacteroidales bacterium]|jgi:hypothetical protein